MATLKKKAFNFGGSLTFSEVQNIIIAERSRERCRRWLHPDQKATGGIQ